MDHRPKRKIPTYNATRKHWRNSEAEGLKTSQIHKRKPDEEDFIKLKHLLSKLHCEENEYISHRPRENTCKSDI